MNRPLVSGSERHRGEKHVGEGGFTLVEVLVAIVVLVFGLMAVTNLLLVAGTSNSVAKHGGAAATAAAAMMETLKATPAFDPLGGPALVATAGDINSIACPSANCVVDDVPGVGLIQTKWSVEPAMFDPVSGATYGYFITVQSEGLAPLVSSRSQASFTTFRACTDTTPGGCP